MPACRKNVTCWRPSSSPALRGREVVANTFEQRHENVGSPLTSGRAGSRRARRTGRSRRRRSGSNHDRNGIQVRPPRTPGLDAVVRRRRARRRRARIGRTASEAVARRERPRRPSRRGTARGRCRRGGRTAPAPTANPRPPGTPHRPPSSRPARVSWLVGRHACTFIDRNYPGPPPGKARLAAWRPSLRSISARCHRASSCLASTTPRSIWSIATSPRAAAAAPR